MLLNTSEMNLLFIMIHFGAKVNGKPVEGVNNTDGVEGMCKSNSLDILVTILLIIQQINENNKEKIKYYFPVL
jgi:hypothetical protein